MAKKQIMVPIDSNGNQTTYNYYYNDKGEIPNYEFSAVLSYNGFDRGRSSLHINWKDIKTGKKYVSSMALLDSSMENCNKSAIINGTFSIMGDFTFKKQGTSVLLTRV